MQKPSIERRSGGKIVPKRLLDNHPRPSSAAFVRRSRLTQSTNNLLNEFRRHGQVVKPVRNALLPMRNESYLLRQGLESGLIVKLRLLIENSRAQPAGHARVGRAA